MAPSVAPQACHVHGLRRPPLRCSEFVRSACLDSITHPSDGRDHSAYIPDHGNCPVTARTMQGVARVRSGQAPAWPLSSDRSVRRGSGVKRDFACTFTRHFPPVLVVLRSQSRLRLEGRARTLSGPSPDLSPGRTLAPSVVWTSVPDVTVGHPHGKWAPMLMVMDGGPSIGLRFCHRHRHVPVFALGCSLAQPSRHYVGNVGRRRWPRPHTNGPGEETM